MQGSNDNAPEEKKFHNLITDEMLVRMVVLILKDMTKLLPYLDRLVVIAADTNHPVFKDHGEDPEVAKIMAEGRIRNIKAFTALLNLLAIDAFSGHGAIASQIKKSQNKAAVDKAMRDLGI